ncbi:uncharacterized protein LOC112569117 isoform X3 [Pomacea canaliculata]|uniref:uncharacterized protein LOC112569117 isoform X3 n=1 Tax=Pomacea canaliculata TaxID=400727 RepID=UPI000D73498F|nr:uncharacterized protein LOC112569117 isoform X3 [Pomacea canaliculata]
MKQRMSDGCHLVYAAYLALSLCGTVTVVSAAACIPETCGMDSGTYVQSRGTCTLQVFTHPPKEYMEERCGRNQPYNCNGRYNRFNSMRGLSRRLRVDVEHYLPSGRVTHLTFATADDRHKAFSASLVVVQRANPLTYPLTVRVVAVADISCPANSRTAVDQCVKLKKELIINTDESNYHLGFFSADDDINQQDYNWNYAVRRSVFGTYVSRPLVKVLEVGDEVALTSATSAIDGWADERIYLYINARIERASCYCDQRRMCGAGGRCRTHLAHCECDPGYMLQDKTCKACPKTRYGPGCERVCDCVNAEYCDNNGNCVCEKGYQGIKCDIDSDLCPCTLPYVCYKDAVGAVRCACPLGSRMLYFLCATCMQGTHGLNCASKCNCNEMYTLDTTCDPVTGQCRCRPGWTGLKCDQNVNECETLDRPCPALEKCFNTPGSYRCDCIENFVRVNGKCEELGFEVITDPISPFLDRATPIYIVLSVGSTHSLSISFEIIVDEIICQVTLWSGKPGPDGYAWDQRPFAWTGPLRKINWPRTVYRLFYFFSHRVSRIRVNSTTHDMPPSDQQIRADASNNSKAWELCLSQVNLKGASPSAYDLKDFRVPRDSDLHVYLDMKIPPCSKGSLLTSGQWLLYPYTPPMFPICPDFSTLEPIRLRGRMTDTRLIIPARYLPSGILRICNNFTIMETQLGTRRILKCGYVEIQPVNKIIFILKPVTQHPINVLLDTSIVFDAREIYSLEDNETDKQLHGEFNYDWHCNEVTNGVPMRPCGNRFPILKEQRAEYVSTSASLPLQQ